MNRNINIDRGQSIEKTMDLIKLSLDGYYKLSSDPEYIKYGSVDKITIKLSGNDIDNNKIRCYVDDKVLYKGSCTFIGKVGSTLDEDTPKLRRFAWQWGWAIPGVSKSFSSKAHSLLNYSLVSFNDSDELLSQIKQYMINANSVVTDVMDYEIILALAIYLTKIKLLIGIKISKEDYERFLDKLQKKEENITLTSTKSTDRESTYKLFFSLV